MSARRAAGGAGRGVARRHESRGRQEARAPEGERGSGTVLVLALAAVVVLLALGIAALGSAQRGRGSAQAAADLGALAAATAVRHGADACSVADQAVQRNGAELVGCVLGPGGVVDVDAARPTALSGDGPWGALLGEATARARAGPRST